MNKRDSIVRDALVVFCLSTLAIGQNGIPACPAGAQSVQRKDTKGNSIFSCKYSGKVENGMEQCAEWEGSFWNKSVTVPCGSGVAYVVKQNASERQIGCPANRQVYRWNNSKNSLDDRKTCLPEGWESTELTDNGCPAGFEPAGIDGQDICVGRKMMLSGSGLQSSREKLHTYQADELASMSASNLARFNRDFLHKSVRVVGRVDEIESDGTAHFWVANAGNNHTSIEIKNPKSSRLTLEMNKGETVVVTGYYAGVDPDFAAPRLIIIAQKIERR